MQDSKLNFCNQYKVCQRMLLLSFLLKPAGVNDLILWKIRHSPVVKEDFFPCNCKLEVFRKKLPRLTKAMKYTQLSLYITLYR